MVRVAAAEVLAGFSVRLQFTDGASKEVDLRPFLHGPIFEPMLRDPELFRSVKVDHELGTLVWENGADVDPDVLHEGLTPAWMEEALPRPARSSPAR
ncbi:MAG: DUF2442 domain-containing protein [Chloroflexota bacterium]|nr:DUF2442 domain-containing protein [Chloroflexota bacterium]